MTAHGAGTTSRWPQIVASGPGRHTCPQHPRAKPSVRLQAPGGGIGPGPGSTKKPPLQSWMVLLAQSAHGSEILSPGASGVQTIGPLGESWWHTVTLHASAGLIVSV
ncbi:MAG: hypothetical protein JST22_18610 [Bacteroidetes bacterium]|nr:hypothetical protein [Bacteroidota bacterium]